MQNRFALSILGSTLLLGGCVETDDNIENDLDLDRSTASLQVASFDPSAGTIPFPNNLLFPPPGAPTDGTINIPVADETDKTDPQVAINTLDGFSTIAPISTTLSEAIDAGTLNGDSVKLYEVTLSPEGAVTSVVRALGYGAEYAASVSSVDPDGKTLVISPLAPLKPKTGYLAAITTAVQSTTGDAVKASSIYLFAKHTSPLIDEQGNSQTPQLTNEQAQALEGLRQLTNVQELQLAGQGISSDIVALSWTFTTQSIGDVLSVVRDNTSGVTGNFTHEGDTIAQLPPGAGLGLADIYSGELTLPYYLTNNTNSTLESIDPLNKHWQGPGGSHLTQYNTTAIKTSDETIPLLLSIPKTGSAPWPVVIFQHGITQNRTNMLAVADTLASIGFASVAIDMPLHGIAPVETLYSGMERTFDLDLADNTTSAPGPDGTADSSGTHYINLSYLITTRDNVRQSIADLFALYDSLATLDFDSDATADLDTSRVYFVGHSLGGMVGVPFLALEPGVRDAVIAMSGGGIAKLLDGSASFGPRIAAGLAANDVMKGEATYESFMGAAQTLVDSGDPANYAAAAAADRGILVIEVVGDGADKLPDQVIPNNVMADAPADTVPAPLSGTDPLVALFGANKVSATTSSTDNMLSVIRFTSGDHSSILDPTSDATVTTVMQTAMATFLASDGLQTAVSDDSVVEQ